MFYYNMSRLAAERLVRNTPKPVIRNKTIYSNNIPYSREKLQEEAENEIYWNKKRKKEKIIDLDKILDTDKLLKKKIREKIYLDKAKDISIFDIEKYDWYILSKFYYWIFHISDKIWWIRFHWLNIDDFFIQISVLEKWYIDINILDNKWIFTDNKNLPNLSKLKNNIKFKNNKWVTWNIEELIGILNENWIILSLIEVIIRKSFPTWNWNTQFRDLFVSQRKLLESLKEDKNKRALMNIYGLKHKKIKDEYVKLYGCTPIERYFQKYTKALKYIWKENKIFIHSDNDFRNKIINLNNEDLVNLNLRKKIFEKQFYKLFPKEQF